MLLCSMKYRDDIYIYMVRIDGCEELFVVFVTI